MQYLFVVVVMILLIPGQVRLQQSKRAQDIIDKAIVVHGGKAFQNCAFSFDFRDRTYTYRHKKGKYRYTRRFKDDEGRIVTDILTNDGFERTVNGERQQLTQEDASRYANSVNSVHYFAFLPYFLNDPAVNKELLGEAVIEGETYYKIRVTFDKEGGGKDFEDIHMYWIHKDHFTMDYMGYSYEVDGGGVRFRKAYNAREVGKIRFQDYINYKHDKNTPVEEMDHLYENGELQELSRIELKRITRI